MRIAFAWGVPPDYFFDRDDRFIATAITVIEETNQ